MKKQFLINSLIYFIAIIGACLVNLAASSLVMKIVNLFVVVDYYIGAIICTVVAFIIVCGVLGALSFFESFKSVEFAPMKLLVTITIAGVFHLAVSTLLGFHPFIAGGTRYLAGLISMGEKFDSATNVADIYLWEYLLAFAIYLLLNIIAVELGGFWGKRFRIKNRESLSGFSEH